MRTNGPLAKNPLTSECQEMSRVFPRLAVSFVAFLSDKKMG